MNTISKALLAAVLASAAIAASAQSTVGELLDGGARKMNKEQVTAYLSGSTLAGPSSSGEVIMNLDLKAGGSFSGNVSHPVRGLTTGTSGKWAVDETGKTCAEGRLFAWSMNFKECFISYQLGEVVYRTLRDSEDRASAVRKALEQVKPN